MERRRAKRSQIQVDIEMAHPGSNRCRGYAENISRTGISVSLLEGSLPLSQRSVILNFRVWTGNETLYRKIYARVVRHDQGNVALEFVEHDFISDAIIQDLMFYQSKTPKKAAQNNPDCDGMLMQDAEMTA